MTYEVGYYGGLNENGPPTLIGSGTFRKCGLIGGGVSLGAGLHCVPLFLLPADPEVALGSSPAPCLPVCHYDSHRDNNGVNFRQYKPAQLDVFLRVAVVLVSLHSGTNPNTDFFHVCIAVCSPSFQTVLILGTHLLCCFPFNFLWRGWKWSLCTSGCPGTQKDLPASAFWVLGLRSCTIRHCLDLEGFSLQSPPTVLEFTLK